MNRLPHPVPEAARVELERLGARWRTLPLPQALRHAPALRALAQRFADECAGRPSAQLPGAGSPTRGDASQDGTSWRPQGDGTSGSPQIPDLGPAAAYDQLVTLTYDVARHRSTRDPESGAALATELARLRQRLG